MPITRVLSECNAVAYVKTREQINVLHDAFVMLNEVERGYMEFLFILYKTIPSSYSLTHSYV